MKRIGKIKMTELLNYWFIQAKISKTIPINLISILIIKVTAGFDYETKFI